MSKEKDDVLAPAVPEGQFKETAEALGDPDFRDTSWAEAKVSVGGGDEPVEEPPAPKAAPKGRTKKSTPAGARAEGTTSKEN